MRRRRTQSVVDSDARRAEIEELRARLAEAEETLHAIRKGEIDALVVDGPNGDQVFTLSGAETPYRRLVESMTEGAAIVLPDGTVSYCNARLAAMVGVGLESAIGGSFFRFVAEKDQAAMGMLLQRGRTCSGAAEVELRTANGGRVPTLVATSHIPGHEVPAACLIVTDLAASKKAESDRSRLHEQESLRRQAEATTDALRKSEALAVGAREQAQRAVLIRDNVLAIVSHDLKNPLSVITLGAGMLAKSSESPARKTAERIQRAAGAMSELLDDLLDLASIEAGLLRIEPRPCEAALVIHDAVESCAPLGVEKGVSLQAEPPESGTLVACDRHRVQQVFGNLVGNAIKFSPRGTTITIQAETLEKEVRFSVGDCGRGIPADELPHVFERFWQAKSGEARGHGLGLHITKGIVEAHGGQIWVESVVGVGSTFLFTVPRA